MYNWVYLVFPSAYSVLVNHGYTHANIGPWRERIQLNIFPTTMHTNTTIFFFTQSVKETIFYNIYSALEEGYRNYFG